MQAHRGQALEPPNASAHRLDGALPAIAGGSPLGHDQLTRRARAAVLTAGEARSYAERLFTFPVIASLAEKDARAALVEPARNQQVDYEEDAVVRALHWTGGHPFFIQQLGKHAWNLAERSPITRADVEAAMPIAQAALDTSVNEVRVQRVTNQERRYMRAMAELGEGPYRSGEVAAKLGRRTSEVSMTRQHLIDKGLVYATEDYGHVDFTVPRFEEFMRRHMGFRAPARPPRT